MKSDKPKEGNFTMSWLVRCWEEKREVAQRDPVLRCFVRDLRTGEERYLSDPREIGDLMLRQFRTALKNDVKEDSEAERQGSG